MPEPEVTVAKFYEPVMSHRRAEVQRLVIQLLRKEFKQASELEANILAVAAMSRAEPTRDKWASEVDGMITTVGEADTSEGGMS